MGLNLEQLKEDLALDLSKANLSSAQLDVVVKAIHHYTVGLLEIAGEAALETVRTYFKK